MLGIDEESLHKFGGFPGLRAALAEGLERIAPADPKAVAIDVTLADSGTIVDDKRLEAAIRKTPNAVLGCYLRKQGTVWEDPIPRFVSAAAGIGHAHVDTDPVCRLGLNRGESGWEGKALGAGARAYRAGGARLVRRNPMSTRSSAAW